MKKFVDAIKSKVLVISRRESLLGRTVEYLVPAERQWKVLRISKEQDADELIQRLDEESPDVVVISQDDYVDDKQLSIRVLRECVEIKKVVMVSLEENMIEVYCKQRMQIKSAQDLFSEVENQFLDI